MANSIFSTIFAYRYMKEQKPLVSFILTYYNIPVPMLCQCIDSILALSLKPEECEIIVIDDGSDVSPMNGLMQYGESIIYVRQNHSGVSVSRNTGLNMARGEYIQFVDGDDYLLKEPYEDCLLVIRQHPDMEIVMFDFTLNPQAKTNKKSSFLTNGTELMRNKNIRGAIYCYLFRQSIRGSLIFTPGIAYAEDEEFTAQLLLRAELVCVTRIQAYFYRQRSSSAVHQLDVESIDKRLNDTHDIILHLHQIADKQPNNERLALQRRIAQLCMDYLYNTIIYTRSSQALNNRIEGLCTEGLFPLPHHDYSEKYKWFCKIVNTRLGRQLLLHTLPRLKHER